MRYAATVLVTDWQNHGVDRRLIARLLLAKSLDRHPAPEARLRRALDAARAWLDADPETEPRLRLGLRRAAGDGFPGRVETDLDRFASGFAPSDQVKA
jgi:hypothetical protein